MDKYNVAKIKFVNENKNEEQVMRFALAEGEILVVKQHLWDGEIIRNLEVRFDENEVRKTPKSPQSVSTLLDDYLEDLRTLPASLFLKKYKEFPKVLARAFAELIDPRGRLKWE